MDPTPYARETRRRRDALMLFEHFAGGSLTRALFADATRRTEAAMSATLEPVRPGMEPVPEAPDGLSAEAFVQGPLQANTPMVFRRAASDWPAVRQWTPEFFAERFGHETVRILHMGPDQHEAEDYGTGDLPMGDALARLDEGDRAYLRFLPTLMAHPELLDDLDMDWVRAHQGSTHDGNMQLFIGGQGTATATHTGISSNLFFQIHGRKTWKIFSPEWTHAFKPPMRRSLYFESRFDPDRPDFDAYPDTRHLQGFEVTLEPGDVLFNPPFWWHKVSNPTVSIGVGYRWMPLAQCYRSSRMLTALSLASIDPPMLAAPFLGLDFTRMFTTRMVPRK